ncbi:MAG: NAD-dependent epimerase/dehydratase family protein, partial [Methylocella sp.]
MKIFVAGATGAVGRRLVLLLTAAGHEVAGLTRSPAKADLLRRIGATPVIADALDPSAVMDVVNREKPDVVVHELTSIEGSIRGISTRGFPRPTGCEKRARIICRPPRAPPAHADLSRKALRVGPTRGR